MMDKASPLLPLALLFMQCLPTTAVTVYTSIPHVEVQEFKDAVLSCEFKTEREEHPRIEWKRRGVAPGNDVSFVYFNGHFKGELASRATISGATVTLRRVVQADAGQYRCEISAPADGVTLGETNITLKVLVPPHTPSCEVPSSALTGSVVRLRCLDRHSIPPPTYTWFKDNTLLLSSRHANATVYINTSTGTLEFKPVARTDAGRYSCRSSNGVGSPKMCEAKHMAIDDVNIPGVIASVVVMCLVIAVCGGGYYAHRNGYFSRHKNGRSFWIPQCHGGTPISSQTLHRPEDITSANYSPPPQTPQDFKHTKSFML